MSTIIGVKLEQRVENAQLLQKVATEFGCSIKTRIGLHDVLNGTCSPSGIILFEVINNEQEFENALMAVEGAMVQVMKF